MQLKQASQELKNEDFQESAEDALYKLEGANTEYLQKQTKVAKQSLTDPAGYLHLHDQEAKRNADTVASYCFSQIQTVNFVLFFS